MMSFSDVIASWRPQSMSGVDLLGALSRTSWLAEGHPDQLVASALANLPKKLRPPEESDEPLPQKAFELIRTLRSAEALTGSGNVGPALIRLASITVRAGQAILPPAPIWWLAIDRCPGRRNLPEAILQALRQSIADLRDEDAGRRNADCVLLVSVTGNERARPDIIVVGPAFDRDRRPTGESCIRTFLFSRMHTEADTSIRQRADQLANGLKRECLRDFFKLSAAGDARNVVRNQLKSQLTALMELLEALPSAPHADTAEALQALREAATVVVFRMMFLGEVERRGLLWAPEARRRKLYDGAAAALDEVHAAGEAGRSDDLVSMFFALCATLRGAKPDPAVEVSGGSLFATQPNAQFDSEVVSYLRTVDSLSTALAPDVRARWRVVLAETYQITQGVLINRTPAGGRGQAQEDLGYFGFGGSGHVHRILGDVYEQILALQPKRVGAGIELAHGSAANERRSLGAHYTPESLVEELVRPALGVVFAHHWKATGGNVDAYCVRIAGLRVVDPAMGSAHFLTVAAREIATELEWSSRFGQPRHVMNPDAHEPMKAPHPLLGEAETSAGVALQEGIARRLRDVVQRCCHGVDVSPIAVELGKLSLWLFTMAAQATQPGREANRGPGLAFLDANIQCGDSLIGMLWRDVPSTLQARFGLTLHGRTTGDQLDIFGAHGHLVADKLDDLGKLLTRVHSDDAHLLEWAKSLPAGVLADDLDRTSHYAVRRALHEHVQGEFRTIRWAFDLAVLAVFFDVKRGRSLNATALEDVLRPILGRNAPRGAFDWERVLSEPVGTRDQMVLAVREAVVQVASSGRLVKNRPMRAFHWALAFPDVFAGGADGFDVVIANPPFIGDHDLNKAIGKRAVLYVSAVHTSKRNGGTCDLAGFFILRYADIAASSASVCATLAPNSLAQGKNRQEVLVPLLKAAKGRELPEFVVYRAVQSMPWPAEAAVHVCMVWVARPGVEARLSLVDAREHGPKSLHECERISTFLDETLDAVGPLPAEVPLPGARPSLFHQGMIVRGTQDIEHGFVKRAQVAAAFAAEARRRGEGRALVAYLNNEQIQDSRTPVAREIAVDFFDALAGANLLTEPAEIQFHWLTTNFPYCLQSLSGVQASRGDLSESVDDTSDRDKWWLFARPRPELRRQWSTQDHVVVAGRAAGKHWLLTHIPRIDTRWGVPICPSEALSVLPSASAGVFSVLQSALGEIHIRRNSSTLKSDLRFSAEFALSGFPFPWSSQWSSDAQGPFPIPVGDGVEVLLEPATRALAETRSRLLLDPEHTIPEIDPVPAGWGPTALYNEYNREALKSPGVERLRGAHVSLLESVLEVYSRDESLPVAGRVFADIRMSMAGTADHGWAFERPWIDGTERYVPKELFRRRIIEALLQANVERYQQEIQLFLQAIEEHAASDERLRSVLGVGVDAAALLGALRSLPIKLHASDAGAVLEEGVRSGRWARKVGDPKTMRWLSAASTTVGTRTVRQRQTVASTRGSTPVNQPTATRAPVSPSATPTEPPSNNPGRRTNTTSNSPQLGLGGMTPGGSGVLKVVKKSATPLNKGEILALSETPEEEWSAARVALEESSDVVRLGTARGTRYIGWTALLRLIVEAIKKTDDGEGATKAAVVANLEERETQLDDDVWRQAVVQLIDAGRITKTGQARGTKYQVA